MSWGFYNSEGRLLYDVVAGSVGDAATLGGTAPSGYVRIGSPGLNSGDVDLDGSLTLPLVTVNSNTNLDATHRTVVVDSSVSAIQVTLPNSPLTGQVYEIRDGGNNGAGNASNFNITVARANGAHRIDGVLADLVLSDDGVGRVFVFDGANWVTLANRYVPTSGAIDADTLDGLDSTQFLRSDTTDTAAGAITFSEVTTFSKSTYSPVEVVDDTTNPNLLDDTSRTVIADSASNGNPVTVTLPASPATGQWYEVIDNGTASVDNITIDPNGNSVNGSGSNITLDTDYDSIVLVCTDPGNWKIVAWRFPPAGSVVSAIDDLSDVTVSGPAEGEILRYDTPANQWVNDGNVTVDDSGVLHLNLSASGGLSLGDDAGGGNEWTITWFDDASGRLNGRTIQNGTPNQTVKFLENGVVPAGNTYSVSLPTDNTLLCRTAAGDLYLRLPSKLNPSSVPVTGDTVTAKDIEGQASINVLAFIAEGVRKRDVPELALDSPTGSIASSISTTTPGALGTDEVQNFQVTGSGTYEIDFDGQVTAATLDETSDAATVEAAINSLSPHPNYGYFSVSVTGTDATSGLAVTFDGGALIDGEAQYTFPSPWSSARAINGSDISTDDWFVI